MPESKVIKLLHSKYRRFFGIESLCQLEDGRLAIGVQVQPGMIVELEERFTRLKAVAVPFDCPEKALKAWGYRLQQIIYSKDRGRDEKASAEAREKAESEIRWLGKKFKIPTMNLWNIAMYFAFSTEQAQVLF